MKKILVTLGLAFALVSTAVAGLFTHTTSGANQSYSAVVSVPSAGGAFQYAWAQTPPPGGPSGNTVINNGPAGNYTLAAGQSLKIEGYAVAAGNYNVYQYVGWAGGYSTTVISW